MVAGTVVFLPGGGSSVCCLVGVLWTLWRVCWRSQVFITWGSVPLNLTPLSPKNSHRNISVLTKQALTVARYIWMTKVSSVTWRVWSLQFNFASRFRTIVGFSRKTVIYKQAICFELQIAKLSAAVSHCDMRSTGKLYLNLMRGSLVDWDVGKLLCLPARRHLLPLLGKIL